MGISYDQFIQELSTHGMNVTRVWIIAITTTAIDSNPEVEKEVLPMVVLDLAVKIIVNNNIIMDNIINSNKRNNIILHRIHL